MISEEEALNFGYSKSRMGEIRGAILAKVPKALSLSSEGQRMYGRWQSSAITSFVLPKHCRRGITLGHTPAYGLMISDSLRYILVRKS